MTQDPSCPSKFLVRDSGTSNLDGELGSCVRGLTPMTHNPSASIGSNRACSILSKFLVQEKSGTRMHDRLGPMAHNPRSPSKLLVGYRNLVSETWMICHAFVCHAYQMSATRNVNRIEHTLLLPFQVTGTRNKNLDGELCSCTIGLTQTRTGST